MQVYSFNAAATAVPAFNKFFAPTMRALHYFGGEATIDQITEFVAHDLGLNTKQRIANHPHYPGRNLVKYRAGWARTFLRKAGFIDTAERGVWTLTLAGRNLRTVGAKREKQIMSFFRGACAARVAA